MSHEQTLFLDLQDGRCAQDYYVSFYKLVENYLFNLYSFIKTQYEREKQLRKGSDQKLLEIEDAFDGERKEATVKVESLTSIVKMFELKSKNSQDHSKLTLFNYKAHIISMSSCETVHCSNCKIHNSNFYTFHTCTYVQSYQLKQIICKQKVSINVIRLIFS